MKKRNIICLVITLIIALLLYYLFLPAFNLQSIGFWMFIIILLGIYFISSGLFCFDDKGRLLEVGLSTKVTGVALTIIIIGIILVDLFLSPLFQSKSYAKRIEINENSNFVTDVKQVSFNQLPLLDKESSNKIGDRVMGQMPEMVSQYYVSELYTQINYKDDIIRVTPLEYNGLFKYINNHKTGVTGYITVNSVDGTANLVKLEKGMKYMPSAILNEDLRRHLRFSYLTDIFGTEKFEIDNEGNPYWIIPTMKYTGIGLKREVSGIIVLDPITGNSKKYKIEDVPTWVDHVYDADLIIEQVNDWGKYKEGFLNSIFSETNVVMTTEGYNYTVMNDDVYLYTGITSVSTDESNIGFVLTNMRTKKTNFYTVPGAEEYSAMSSAEGQVQQMNYTSTFPLLINLNNKPTYLMSLKDNAGLVKMYAFVDVENYQKVVVTDASEGIEKAAQNYLGDEQINVGSDTKNKEITIYSISNALIDGNTVYYIKDIEGNKYKVSIKVAKDVLPYLEVGDNLKIYYKDLKNVTEIIKVE